ncbi:MAG TPA: alpha/beta hydrolase [Clostridiales bacterium]|nr:alpha/beta hydrolase [Clostridiales bacterium]
MQFIAVGAVISLLAIVFAITWHLSNRVINIKTLSPEEIKKIDEEDGISSLEWYEQLKKEKHWIPSAFGYNLYAEYIPVPGKVSGTVIFSHGVTVSHITSIKYMRIFYEQGYNCLVYDHRRHGSSGGRFTSYGYFEKYDLETVVNWLEKNKGFCGKLGIHGESMGSAILLLYAGMNGKADFYIADCPYTTIMDQLLYRMEVEYKIRFKPLLGIVSWIIYLRAGFHLRDVNCLEAVKKVSKPILFIHGSDDDYVPAEMGVKLYNAKPEPKELYLVPNAKHAKALAADPERYRQVVFDFINRCC